jgi:hypothetical protein
MERGKMCLLTALMCFIAVCGNVRGSPSWRTNPPGLSPTTYQKWTFDTPVNPALPEINNNSFGIAMAAVTVNGIVHTDPPGWYDEYLGRTGVWHAERTEVMLEIPNQPIQNLYKEIWVEVGCRGDLVGYSILNPQVGVTSLGYSMVSAGQGWEVLTFGFRIEPNPNSETIWFALQDSGADVDYIIVDTICAPEPATLLILGLGGLLIRKK